MSSNLALDYSEDNIALKSKSPGLQEPNLGDHSPINKAVLEDTILLQPPALLSQSQVEGGKLSVSPQLIEVGSSILEGGDAA